MKASRPAWVSRERRDRRDESGGEGRVEEEKRRRLRGARNDELRLQRKATHEMKREQRQLQSKQEASAVDSSKENAPADDVNENRKIRYERDGGRSYTR
jgi:hypothetical protein